MNNPPTKFPPVTFENWQDLPVFSGRLATKNDVHSRQAVFFTTPDSLRKIYNTKLPLFAICTDSGTGENFPVVVIQAEVFENDVLVGVVKLDGERLVCVLSELKIILNPDKSYFSVEKFKPTFSGKIKPLFLRIRGYWKNKQQKKELVDTLSPLGYKYFRELVMEYLKKQSIEFSFSNNAHIGVFFVAGRKIRTEINLIPIAKKCSAVTRDKWELVIREEMEWARSLA
jgi:hypothetical protein